MHYFGTEAEPECHMCFHFPVTPRSVLRDPGPARAPIVDILADTPAIPSPGGQWSTFLRNHDELTLEMVSTEERARCTGGSPGTRGCAPTSASAAASRCCSTTPARRSSSRTRCCCACRAARLYYGDEIGRGDNIWLPDRARCGRRCSGRRTATPVLHRGSGQALPPAGPVARLPLRAHQTWRPSSASRRACCTGCGTPRSGGAPGVRRRGRKGARLRRRVRARVPPVTPDRVAARDREPRLAALHAGPAPGDTRRARCGRVRRRAVRRHRRGRHLPLGRAKSSGSRSRNRRTSDDARRAATDHDARGSSPCWRRGCRAWSFPAKGAGTSLTLSGVLPLSDDVRVLLVRARAGSIDALLQAPVGQPGTGRARRDARRGRGARGCGRSPVPARGWPQPTVRAPTRTRGARSRDRR